MTATQLTAMNTEIWQGIGYIADNEALMRRLARYVKRLTKEKEDPTLMTKEKFFARVDEAREEIRQGKGIKMLPSETLSEFLLRVG